MLNKILLSILFVAMLFLLLGCGRTETKESYHPNYDLLTKSGEPGNWVPSFIPRSAVKIKERHKIDTGAEALTFEYGSHGDLSLDNVCKKVAANDVLLPPSGFLDLTWWPDSLYSDRSKKEDMYQYKFFCCERQAFLAVRQIENRPQAFYWRISLTDEKAWGCANAAWRTK